MIFYDLLWFFKDLVRINEKEKDKTAFKTAYNRVKEIRWTVLKVEGGVLFLEFREENRLSWKLREVMWTFSFMESVHWAGWRFDF
jgi:uncharacterized protein YktA (UPF0223 family)